MKLLFAASASFLLQVLILYMPVTQRIFRVESLSLLDMAVIILLSSLPLWIMELAKLANRRIRLIPAT